MPEPCPKRGYLFCRGMVALPTLTALPLPTLPCPAKRLAGHAAVAAVAAVPLPLPKYGVTRALGAR